MKTTDVGGTVMDKPKSREAVKPAVDKPAASKPAAKTSQIYVDGKFYAEGEAKVSVFDHGLLYGDGIFEGIRFYNGRIFRLEEHLERLWDSARSICLEMPMSQRAMIEALIETVQRNDLRDGYIRLIVTRGIGNLGLNPEQCKRPSVIIITAQIALYSENVYRNGLTVVTCATRRTNPSALNPAVKSLNYLNNVMARIEANQANADEALMLNDEGNVAECTADNVFIVKHGQIFTPPITPGALRGITRSVAFEIAAETGIKVVETDVTRHDVFIADECFLTATPAQISSLVAAVRPPIRSRKPDPSTTPMLRPLR